MYSKSLSWIPVNNGASVSQSVQYKSQSSGVWITFSTLTPSASSETVTGLSENILYNFQVVNNCTGGGTAASSKVDYISLSCPEVTLTPQIASIGFSFEDLGGDVTSYTVDLLNSDGTSVVAPTQTFFNPSGTVSGSFSGLTPSTTYNVRVKVFATGSLQSYSKTCGSVSSSTLAVPSCGTISSITADMS